MLTSPKPYLEGRYIDCDLEHGDAFRPRTTINFSDITNLVRLFLIEGPIGWAAPEKSWRSISTVFATISSIRYKQRTENNKKFIEAVVSHSRAPSKPIQNGYFARRFEERYGYMRSHRPGGWHPTIRIHGEKHLDQARQEGKGIILWGSRFAFHHLISKIAFHRLGLDVYHYTRPIHGLSHTFFGIKILNPIWTKIERRYLGARVAGEKNVQGAMEVLREVVSKGGIVSITTGNWGKKTVEVPFLDGRLQLATGPAFRAKSWGAVLLPTFTVQASDGSFDISVGEPLNSNQDNIGAYCQEVVEKYANQLEKHFLTNPDQWRGWDLILDRKKSHEQFRFRNR